MGFGIKAYILRSKNQILNASFQKKELTSRRRKSYLIGTLDGDFSSHIEMTFVAEGPVLGWRSSYMTESSVIRAVFNNYSIITDLATLKWTGRRILALPHAMGRFLELEQPVPDSEHIGEP